MIQFDFVGAVAGSMWLVLDPADISVCIQHPGFDVDLLVTADLAALYRVWGGRDTLAGVIRCGLVTLDGPPAITRAFPFWLGWESGAAELVAQTDTITQG